MDGAMQDVLERAWAVLIGVFVPSLSIPVASFVCSVAQGFFGLRDDGVAYAVRVVVMVGVAFATAPAIARSVVDFMAWALR